MRVSVIRSGGFAGVERRGECDTASDPVLRDLLDRVDLNGMPPPGRVPDRFVYEIDVDGRVTTVGEAELTGPLRELVRHVLGDPG
ncbi:protealysin inhibitor emfourin [Thermomonospora amylolytica]|uniref:protealysin inhibitor emfourin n=1 Tax=Thermomonospora amylolytica TaxID=1411117 RepID=UPI001F2A57F5|nr:protealysin inhibitor emfourin [Thermomonospora amylolytica]